MAELGPNLHDKKQFPGMVGWFDPPMLLRIAREAIVSALFGQYADRRLIQAALDPATSDELLKRADVTDAVSPDANGACWVDYVADLGDGFDSTYAIAYLLGQKTLDVGDAKGLPRGQLLIMGGDQVYPAATYENYRIRMLRPYAYAFPDSKSDSAAHPLLYLIPGNHDWYDGLTQFLALFCRARSKHIGSWRTQQRRSYFALKLPHNWWIWGFDSQLGEDIDQPQADYFATVARAMPEGAKVIVCASIPSWMYDGDRFRRGINYVANNILRSEAKDVDVYAVLSGDTHHYNRYSAREDGTQFITAGGGGAFLHPTHTLKDEAAIKWLGQDRHLSLKTTPDAEHKASDVAACYPTREASRNIVWANLRFPMTNPLFFLTLGGLYWLAALFVMAWRSEVAIQPMTSFWSWAWQIASATFVSPAFLVVALAFTGALIGYVDDAKTLAQRLRVGIAHAVPHLLVILLLVSLLPPINATLGAHAGSDWFFLLFAVETIVIGGLVGGFFWGIYLLIVCGQYGLHTNDGFSAMRITGYKHFLRMRLTDKELTIYPIAVDSVPERSGWQYNPAGSQSQDAPYVVPKEPLRPRLIERPVVVRR